MIKHNPIICALDTPDINEAIWLAKILTGKVGMVKLGLEFFTANGLVGVQKIIELGMPVFLDLKLHDIPTTVAKTVAVIKSMDIAMLTLHLSGGIEMLRNALANTNINLVGVTVLTSMDNNDLHLIGIDRTTEKQVALLAKLAKEANLYGIVCSALEITAVRKICGDIKIIVPGVRLEDTVDDQKRTIAPNEAIKLGADYIVVGRPITKSSNPSLAAESILNSLHSL